MEDQESGKCGRCFTPDADCTFPGPRMPLERVAAADTDTDRPASSMAAPVVGKKHQFNPRFYLPLTQLLLRSTSFRLNSL